MSLTSDQAACIGGLLCEVCIIRLYNNVGYVCYYNSSKVPPVSKEKQTARQKRAAAPVSVWASSTGLMLVQHSNQSAV